VTVVVGVRGHKGVILAADSAGTAWGGAQYQRKDAKTFALSDTVAIAYCGSYRLGQLLRYNLDLPDLPLGKDEHEWAVKDFVPAIRKTLKDGGFLTITEGVEELSNSAFLLAVRHRLFAVDEDMQVAEDERPFVADGSGGTVALGHLHALLGDTYESIDDTRLLNIARAAVATASGLNAYVAGKVTHVRTKRWTTDELRIAKEVLAS
jgi:ATP-dependent protease HslVU (ClpYQ) peptidase subunit